MPRSAWPSYLDALEAYLERTSEAIDRGGLAARPPSLASRPIEPPPGQVLERARLLLASTDRLVAQTASRRDEVLIARGVLEGRRRRTRRIGSNVDWAL